MINVNEIAAKVGVNIIESEEPKEIGCWALYDFERKEIAVDPNVDEEIKEQVIVHELIHAVDPVCQQQPGDAWVEICAEARAEIGAKLIVGNSYVDDGFIENVIGGDMELYFNAIDEAEELIKRFGV